MGGAASGDVEDGKHVVLASSDFRWALNLTATTFGPTDWKPLAQQSNNTFRDAPGGTLPILFSPAQMGWGMVTAASAGAIADLAMSGAAPCVVAENVACDYQARWQSLREEAWP